MPREWISGDTVRLAVAKGTLVPAASLGARAHRSSSSRVPNATKRQRGSIDEGSADGDVLDEGPRGRKLFLFRPTVGLIHAGPGDAVPSPGGASTGVPLFGVAASSSLFGISDTESSASVASRGRPPALHAPLEEAFAVAESDAMGDAMGNPTSVEAVLEQLEAAHAQVVAATRAALALPAGVGSRERAALESQRRHAQLAAASVKRWRRAAADDESERSSTGAPSLPSLPGTPESSGRASLPPPALPDLRSPISEIGFAELSTESTKERGAFMERARTNPKDEPLTIQEVSLTSACITKAATKGPHPAGAEPADAPAVHPLMRLGISDSLLQHKKGRRRALQARAAHCSRTRAAPAHAPHTSHPYLPSPSLAFPRPSLALPSPFPRPSLGVVRVCGVHPLSLSLSHDGPTERTAAPPHRRSQGNLLRMFRGATISTPRANPSAGQDAMESEDSPKAKDMQGSAGPSWWRGLRK